MGKDLTQAKSIKSSKVEVEQRTHSGDEIGVVFFVSDLAVEFLYEQFLIKRQGYPEGPR